MSIWLRILAPAAACILAICSFMPSVTFANTEEMITKEYEFQTEDRNDLHYPAIEEIEVEGDIYRLVDVSYDIVEEKEPVAVEKTVTTKDLDDYDRTINKTIDGVRYTLTAEEPDWKKKQIPQQTKRITREYPEGKTPSAQITEDGEIYQIDHQQKKTRKESFHAPAVFYAETMDTRLYWFHGKLVEITGTQPIWAGYEEDIRDYLGLNGNNYFITGMSWDGGFEQTGNGYVRTATVSGQKEISYQIVTYTNDADENKAYEYTAKIRYVDKEGQTQYTARATVTYEKEEKGLPLQTLIMIGAGTAVLCITASVLLFFLARRRSKE